MSFVMMSSVLFYGSDVSKRLEYSRRCRWHLRGRASEWLHRIIHRIKRCCRCRSRAGFADALGAQVGIQRRRLDMSDFVVWHLRRHRHEIVGERAIGELAVVSVDAFLEERRAKA